MTNKIITSDEFITMLAQKAGFTKGDIKVILDSIIEIFEEAVLNRTIIKLKYFGKLDFQQLLVRNVAGYTTKSGEKVLPKILPETTRVTFKLAENIRYADKRKETQ